MYRKQRYRFLFVVSRQYDRLPAGSEEVVGARRCAVDDSTGVRLQGGAERGRGDGTVLAKSDSEDTGNEGGSHGSSGDGVGGAGAADPGREDVDTRSPDIENGTVVGEGGYGSVSVSK